MRLNGAACVQYDGIHLDSLTTNDAERYLTRLGYVCRHPRVPTRVIRLGVGVHSPARDAPDIDRILNEAQAYFRSAEFTSAAER